MLVFPFVTLMAIWAIYLIGSQLRDFRKTSRDQYSRDVGLILHSLAIIMLIIWVCFYLGEYGIQFYKDHLRFAF